MTNNKLTLEQRLAIPEMVKTQSRAQIAAAFGVHSRTIDYHIKALREAGVTVDTRKPGRVSPLQGITNK